MILGFKKQFVPKIKFGTKIHTIREDKHNRWKVGNKMHMAIGVRTKKYKQFCGTLTCIRTQKIFFNWGLSCNFAYGIMNMLAKEAGHKPKRISKKKRQMPLISKRPNVFVDGKMLNKKQINELAINDGFKNDEELFKWFNCDFTGKIIHWTDKKY